MWIVNRIKEIAEEIYEKEMKQNKRSISSTPKHII